MYPSYLTHTEDQNKERQLGDTVVDQQILLDEEKLNVDLFAHRTFSTTKN